MERDKNNKEWQSSAIWSALDHIELTYHDVTVFAIPEFKSLEVLEKTYFCINIIVNQPQN